MVNDIYSCDAVAKILVKDCTKLGDSDFGDIVMLVT